MTKNTVDNLNIDFSFKKNNVDELFFNLGESPEGFKNKDFRYTLSMIYQIVEDEFAKKKGLKDKFKEVFN